MSPPPSSRRFEQSVVRVETADQHGTAFLVQLQEGTGFFLTAFHVVSTASGRGIKLRRGGGRAFAAELVDASEERDIALLSARIPKRLRLKPAALFATREAGRLAVLRMLDPDRGIVAPLVVQVPFVGETAILVELAGRPVVLDKVWSQQGLVIPGGVSGAPVISEEYDAVVAIASAGADQLGETFFVPLISARAPAGQAAGQRISTAIEHAKDAVTRLGRHPNYRGLLVRCWLQTREAVRSLSQSGVYEASHVIARPSLASSIAAFLQSDRKVALLAGGSGVGKSATLAYLCRQGKIGRPIVFLRASQIESSPKALQAALERALKLTGISDSRHLAFSSRAPSPLVIIEGINELAIERHQWPAFIKNELLPFAANLSGLGWRLLISTRPERLDELEDLHGKVSLYDPLHAASAELKQKAKSSLPSILLEGFERAEFERLVEIHHLPAGIPFAELRHPIVFRLMVEASKLEEPSSIRTRDLFTRYFADVIRKIHFRNPGRSRDNIVGLIETWTAADRTVQLGQISSAELGDVSNEALAEAAVSEGLFERVPGGYRYVYDEIFEFVLARVLIGKFHDACRHREMPRLQLLNGMIDSKIPEGAIARALEMHSDSDPAAHRTFAEDLARELHGRAPTDETLPGYMAPLWKMNKLIRVLSRVEKGGPLDAAKDELPLFGAPGLSAGSTWDVDSGVAMGLAYDHISYAYDEARIWQMVRLAAILEPDDDSYPFRSKDLYRDEARLDAVSEIEEYERYKVVKHFVTVFPDRAIERLLAGLSDEEAVGKEHSFATFCAQVILVFVGKFDRSALVARLVRQPGYLTLELLQQLSMLHPHFFLELFAKDEAGLIGNPQLSASLLVKMASMAPDLEGAAVKTAMKLIKSHGHPVLLYPAFFKSWSAQTHKGYIRKSVIKAWKAGQGSGSLISACLEADILSLDEAIGMCADRLNASGSSWQAERPGFLISGLGSHLRGMEDAEQVLGYVDLIIDRFWQADILKTKEQLHATEVLINISLSRGTVRPRLLRLLESVCKQFPGEALADLRYPLLSEPFWHLAESLRRQICVIFIVNCDQPKVLNLIGYAFIKLRSTEIAREFTAIAAEYLGSAAVFDYAKMQDDRVREAGFKPPRGFVNLLQALSEMDRQTFDRYFPDHEAVLGEDPTGDDLSP